MDKVGNRYTPLERLGSGAMGVVWRAHDELLHREVAVKQLLLPDLDAAQVDEACRRAMREARIAARLHHPNAIGVFDVVVEDGKPCLVMEFLPSRSLSAVLVERGALPAAEAARIGGHIATALAAAHKAGVVHRDIKPGNVLMGHDGVVKITDFGISRAVGDVTVTRTGMLAGTLAYLAPELARGAEPTPAADVFSLGATLYAVVEGRPPFGSGDNDLGLLHRIAGGRIVPPTRSGPLTALLTRLLANDPSARPTADQAAGELAALATSAATPGAMRPAPTAGAAPPTPTAVATPPAWTAVAPLRPTAKAPAPPLAPSPERPAAPPVRTPERSVAPPVPTGRPPAGTTAPARRWTAAAVAAVVAVAIATTVLVMSLIEEDGQSGSGAPGTTSVTPSAEPPQADVPDATAISAFVRSHFANLPHDPATARENWTPENRPSEWDDDQYWAGFTEVTVVGEPEVTDGENVSTVVLALALTPRGGEVAAIERYRVSVVVRDDRLLIDDFAEW